MCLGSSKAAKRAAAAQAQAMESLAAAQRAKTTDMVSRTNSTVKTNSEVQKRGIYTLRIPLSQQVTGGSSNSSYGLNIPL